METETEEERQRQPKKQRERERETVELSNLGVPKAYTAKGTKP